MRKMLNCFKIFKERSVLLSHPKSVSVRTALVYEGELAPSVEADGFFDAIVRFRDLFGV